MKILCKLFGHRLYSTLENHKLGFDYLHVYGTQVDGINRTHLIMEAECCRCGEMFYVGRVHVPKEKSS